MVAITPVFSSVSAAETNPNYDDEEFIAEIEEEIEYLFTEIITKDEDNNEYQINEQNLSNSDYTNAEQEEIKSLAHMLNQNEEIALEEGEFSTQSNTLQRCIEDAANIGQGALNEVQEAIDQGNWATVAGYMVAAGFATQPIAVFTFAITCGATPVS